jgi:hypothetical protein
MNVTRLSHSCTSLLKLISVSITSSNESLTAFGMAHFEIEFNRYCYFEQTPVVNMIYRSHSPGDVISIPTHGLHATPVPSSWRYEIDSHPFGRSTIWDILTLH